MRPATYDQWSDEDLAAAAAAGDDAAFEALVGRYLRPLYGFVYRYIGVGAEAGDITQDAFVRAWKHIGRFDPEKKFRTWLYAIAKNAARDWMKKKKPTLFSDATEEGEDGAPFDIEDDAPLPDEIFAGKEAAVMVEAALEALAPDDRAVLLLHYHEHLTFEEIAEVLGSPMNTVKSRHRRALIKLRGFMGNQLS